MTSFLHWHTMTWVFVLWSGYIATWMVVSGPGPAIVALWRLAGMIVFDLLWLVTRSWSPTGTRAPGPVRQTRSGSGKDSQSPRRHGLEELTAYGRSKRSHAVGERRSD